MFPRPIRGTRFNGQQSKIPAASCRDGSRKHNDFAAKVYEWGKQIVAFRWREMAFKLDSRTGVRYNTRMDGAETKPVVSETPGADDDLAHQPLYPPLDETGYVDLSQTTSCLA
jgi:hypothetical protein